jgi:DNA invertase Pin-like site-specific DNA recombinase
MDGKSIAYYRVSTDHQGVNDNGMSARAAGRTQLPQGSDAKWRAVVSQDPHPGPQSAQRRNASQ